MLVIDACSQTIVLANAAMHNNWPIEADLVLVGKRSKFDLGFLPATIHSFYLSGSIRVGNIITHNDEMILIDFPIEPSDYQIAVVQGLHAMHVALADKLYINGKSSNAAAIISTAQAVHVAGIKPHWMKNATELQFDLEGSRYHLPVLRYTYRV